MNVNYDPASSDWDNLQMSKRTQIQIRSCVRNSQIRTHALCRKWGALREEMNSTDIYRDLHNTPRLKLNW